MIKNYYHKHGKDARKSKNNKHNTFKNADDDFDLSTFVKESLIMTKEALCIDELKTVMSRRYQRILDEYPENRKQIYKMIKDTSEQQCNSATNLY